MSKKESQGVFSKIKLQKGPLEPKILKQITFVSDKVRGINDALFNAGLTRYSDYVNRKTVMESGIAYHNADDDIGRKGCKTPGKAALKKHSLRMNSKKALISNLLQLEENKRRTFLITHVRKEKAKAKELELAKRSSSKRNTYSPMKSKTSFFMTEGTVPKIDDFSRNQIYSEGKKLQGNNVDPMKNFLVPIVSSYNTTETYPV